MTDPRIRNLAKILVRYSAAVQPEQKVAVRGTPLAEPLLVEVYREILKAEAYPQIAVDLPDIPYYLLKEANEKQLEFVSPFFEILVNEFDCLINIRAASNTRALTSIDPERQRIQARARGPAMQKYMQRGASGDLRWVLTIFPTEAYAQDAEMSLTEFEDFVYSATYADTQDPVGEWLEIRAQQQRLVDWLAGREKVRVAGANVDLSLSIEGRKFRNSDGDRNMPSGEIYTCPVEESVEGWIKFSYPAILHGNEVRGVRLQFEKGKVVHASAEENGEFLLKMLDTDAGARYLGEFAIGTNKRINRFMRNILYDEKMGGTMHVALGMSYPELGGMNTSAIHWDMIWDMRSGGQIHVDDELIYEAGEFLI